MSAPEEVEVIQALIDTYPELRGQYAIVKRGSVPDWMEQADSFQIADQIEWGDALYRLKAGDEV